MEATAASPAPSTPVSEPDHRPVRGARRRSLVVVLLVVLVVAGVAGGVWWRVWVEDPLEAQLAELASDPAAALDYLAPIDDAEQADTDDDTSKEDGDLWVPSDEAHQHWDQLADRRWGTKGITALTQALAAASSLRNTDTSTDDNRRATWATAQGVILLANHTGQLTDQAKANVGVVLGNCPTELMALAQRVHITATGPDGYYTTTPLTTGGTDQQAITTATAHLMYEVADSTEAAYEISRSATAYTAARASQYMNTHGASTDTLADFYARNADALNLLALLGNTTDAVNAGTAASTDLLTITTNTNGQHTITHTPTTTPQPNPTITTDTPGLLTPAYTNAFNAGLINNPPDPNTTTWYTVDTNGGHHITLKTNEQQRNFYTWVTDGSGNSLGVKDVMNRIGINGNSERWRTTDEFKEYYGGDEW